MHIKEGYRVKNMSFLQRANGQERIFLLTGTAMFLFQVCRNANIKSRTFIGDTAKVYCCLMPVQHRLDENHTQSYAIILGLFIGPEALEALEQSGLVCMGNAITLIADRADNDGIGQPLFTYQRTGDGGVLGTVFDGI